MKNKEEMRIYKRDWERNKRGSTMKTLISSNTWKGRKAELMAQGILIGSVDMNLNIMNYEYDLLWNNNKIDVKSCNLYKRKNKRGKPVELKKQGGLNFNNGITIGQKSKKFNKYLIKNKYV